MTPDETRSVLLVLTTAYDRQIPNGLDTIWAATLDDIPYGLAHATALELIRVSPHLPRVADFRERARLIKASRERDANRSKQLEARQWTPSPTPRIGADMVRHVLGRLADAGQEVRAGKLLGIERAGDIAAAACEEWLKRAP